VVQSKLSIMWARMIILWRAEVVILWAISSLRGDMVQSKVSLMWSRMSIVWRAVRYCMRFLASRVLWCNPS